MPILRFDRVIVVQPGLICSKVLSSSFELFDDRSHRPDALSSKTLDGAESHNIFDVEFVRHFNEHNDQTDFRQVSLGLGTTGTFIMVMRRRWRP